MTIDALTPDQARLRDRARELAQEAAAQAAATDRSEQYPWPMVARMQQAGFTGLTIPREWGGLQGLRRLWPHCRGGQYGCHWRHHGLWDECPKAHRR